ncbi:uncharacterized protein LOC135193428 [Vanessa tameamea]|uniref:Uncharacterized protein LOC135193428 n=1 Tax=Vanessa tameamea TaxID=334116 RepID=A0ABM4AKU1_VANTA
MTGKSSGARPPVLLIFQGCQVAKPNSRTDQPVWPDIWVKITLMLITLTFFFIMYLYALTFLSVNGQLKPVEWMVYNFKIAVFLLLLFAISWSAQSVQNSSDLLKRRLGKLLINSLSDADTFKATKDFLHLVSNCPIKTQGFGSIDVDMTLVPKFVMFFTSYTVIALQFNNVV